MRPRFYFLCLPPLALAAATLSLLGRTDLAPLTDPELLKALDPSDEEELWQAQRRWEDKRHVTCELLDGRLTLWQAAAHFREIGSTAPPQIRDLRPSYCATEKEWACHQVIVYVHAELAINRRAPAQAAEWARRLEAELWGARRPEGAPRLYPDREPAGEPDH